MPEQIPEWLNDVDITDEDKSVFSKYQSQDEAFKGAANAIRMAGSPDRIIEGFENLDLAKIDETKRNKIQSKINRILEISEKPEDYTVERPKDFPKGLSYDNALEDEFRTFAVKRLPKSIFSAIIKWWNDRIIKQHQEYETATQKAEDDFKREIGDDNYKAILGDPKDIKNIGTAKQCILRLSSELGMDYRDKNGNPQSHLADAFELFSNNSPMGDKIPVVKMLQLIWNKNYAQGGMPAGVGITGKKGAEEERIEELKKKYPKSWQIMIK